MLNQKAFTLIEVMVAVGVMLSGLVGVLILVAYSFFAYRDADNALIASHLAEEAVEVVVGIRNTNWVQGGDDVWDVGIPTTTSGTVNYNDSESVQTDRDTCLRYDGNYYLHPADPSTCNTPFRRYLEISYNTETINGKDTTYMDVLAVVEWTQGQRTPETRVSHRLYNWR